MRRMRTQRNNYRRNWNSSETRNYYPRPTPPDIQYEERSKFHTSKYNGSSLINWNIDGKRKY